MSKNTEAADRTRSFPADDALIDQWWTSCDDTWAVPEDVMVRFARDVLERWGAADGSE